MLETDTISHSDTIYVGDQTYESRTWLSDNLVIMRTFPDKYFPLAVVDPPYAINATKMAMGSAPNRTKGGCYASTSTVQKLKGRLNSGSGKLKDRILNTSEFDWDNEPPPPEYWQELFRISENQIIWGGNYFDLPPTRCIICWDKLQPWDNFSQWEMAWTSFDYPAKMYRISNTGGTNKKKKIHPTEKPVALYDQIFRDFAEPGMRVFDSHMGSGNSRISAAKAMLHFYGCERSEIHYWDHQAMWRDEYQKIKLRAL